MSQDGFRSYQSLDELDADDRSLVKRAMENRSRAYAPYSKFKVGAAIKLSDGSIADGFNIENASYPMCICAERVAIGNALVRIPEMQIKSLAVIAGHTEEPAFPCGACRQVMYEMEYRQGESYRVIIASDSGHVIIAESAKALLPYSFRPDFLI